MAETVKLKSSYYLIEVQTKQRKRDFRQQINVTVARIIYEIHAIVTTPPLQSHIIYVDYCKTTLQVGNVSV